MTAPAACLPPAGWPTLDTLALQGLAGDFVRAVAPHTEADPAAVLAQFLAAAGNALGRSAYFVADGSRHHANLFPVIVGKTAKARKGTSWRWVDTFMRRADDDWGLRLQSGMSSGEGLITAVRDPNGDDPGVIEKRLFVIEEELGRVFKVLGRDGNTLSAIIRNAWDGVDLQVMTKTPVRASGAHISVVAHITLEELTALLSATDAANGVANRFLWVCARRSKLLSEGGTVEDSALNSLTSRLQWALSGCRNGGRITRSTEAKKLWAEEYERLSEESDGRLGMVTSRGDAQVTRLSLVYALLDGSNTIEPRHHHAAVALWRYCEDSARFIFGDALVDLDADKLLKALRAAPNGLDRTAISSNLFKRHRTADEITQKLQQLADSGLAQLTTTATGGRPVHVWRAIPIAPTGDAKEAKKANEATRGPA
jgi:hypothetical protein